MLPRTLLCLLLTLATTFAAEPSEAKLNALYDAHEWFRLRDAVGKDSPPFYQGAVAAAFQDVRQAEKSLRSVIQSQPGSEQAHDAQELLASTCQRAARYNEALALVDDVLAQKPDDPDWKNARVLFSSLAEYPNQSVTQRRSSHVQYSMKDGNLFIPVQVNGKPAKYSVDTGAGISAVSESEAKRLGLTVHAIAAKGKGASGAHVTFSIAVAERVTVGGVHLRHVALLVFRDDEKFFVDLPAKERGVIGLPVLLALETIRWGVDGTFELGFRSKPRELGKANLCFDGDKPIAQIEFQGTRIPVVLDTGSVRTDLWFRFADDFASVVNKFGHKGSKKVSGLGGTVQVQAMTLPELTLRIGGLDTVLRPADVLLQRTASHSELYYGVLGLDLLNQARRVIIDFSAMTLRLEARAALHDSSGGAERACPE